MELVVKLDHVVKIFSDKTVLNDLTFEVKRGTIFTILGPSGVGKSVTLKTIVGLIKPDYGRVFVFGNDITNVRKEFILSVRKKIGFVFQDGALLASLNLFDNVSLPLKEHFKLSKGEIKAKVLSVLESVGLVDSIYKMPSELSGGMRKRAALARCLVTNPELILYDEPTSGLDPVMVTVVNEMIKMAKQKYNVTSILVTHDIHSAFSLSDVIAVFLRGTIVAIGTPQELRNCGNDEVLSFLEGRRIN
ncbi:MAG: ATP-binding cassette domain-containing protein [Planctomycetes bacterium]|nr:ATP-binding cassette domain-containing protein [Planctomycetota bacterium]